MMIKNFIFVKALNFLFHLDEKLLQIIGLTQRLRQSLSHSSGPSLSQSHSLYWAYVIAEVNV